MQHVCVITMIEIVSPGLLASTSETLSTLFGTVCIYCCSRLRTKN